MISLPVMTSHTNALPSELFTARYGRLCAKVTETAIGLAGASYGEAEAGRRDGPTGKPPTRDRFGTCHNSTLPLRFAVASRSPFGLNPIARITPFTARSISTCWTISRVDASTR